MTHLRILALEPYYGGSHRSVLDALMAHIDVDWTLLTLPARKWKWRMRGAAITMADRVAQIRADDRNADWDLLFCSTFLNLAEFKGLCPSIAHLPAIVYFHENQLLYPNRHTAEWDLQFPLTNITSALSADGCVFNTRWNLDGFVAEIPTFLKAFPDHHPAGVADRIAGRSVVIAPPFDPSPFDSVPVSRGEVPRIIWPHRWEHDKNPHEFFEALRLLAARGLEFEVVIAGQAFRETEEEFRRMTDSLPGRIVWCGQPSTKEQYAELLASSDIAVSTALNEFFGLAMIEACHSGCYPVVPDRLAYPELYPRECRYEGVSGLVEILAALLISRPMPHAYGHISRPFTIEALAPRYREYFSEVASRGG